MIITHIRYDIIAEVAMRLELSVKVEHDVATLNSGIPIRLDYYHSGIKTSN